jgi:SWI/SNF-related matrix-associated actin-dependent regulator 1 of chromatin subfamily A
LNSTPSQAKIDASQEEHEEELAHAKLSSERAVNNEATTMVEMERIREEASGASARAAVELARGIRNTEEYRTALEASSAAKLAAMEEDANLFTRELMEEAAAEETRLRAEHAAALQTHSDALATWKHAAKLALEKHRSDMEESTAIQLAAAEEEASKRAVAAMARGVVETEARLRGEHAAALVAHRDALGVEHNAAMEAHAIALADSNATNVAAAEAEASMRAAAELAREVGDTESRLCLEHEAVLEHHREQHRVDLAVARAAAQEAQKAEEAARCSERDVASKAQVAADLAATRALSELSDVRDQHRTAIEQMRFEGRLELAEALCESAKAASIDNEAAVEAAAAAAVEVAVEAAAATAAATAATAALELTEVAEVKELELGRLHVQHTQAVAALAGELDSCQKEAMAQAESAAKNLAAAQHEAAMNAAADCLLVETKAGDAAASRLAAVQQEAATKVAAAENEAAVAVAEAMAAVAEATEAAAKATKAAVAAAAEAEEAMSGRIGYMETTIREHEERVGRVRDEERARGKAEGEAGIAEIEARYADLLDALRRDHDIELMRECSEEEEGDEEDEEEEKEDDDEDGGGGGGGGGGEEIVEETMMREVREMREVDAEAEMDALKERHVEELERARCDAAKAMTALKQRLSEEHEVVRLDAARKASTERERRTEEVKGEWEAVLATSHSDADKRLAEWKARVEQEHASAMAKLTQWAAEETERAVARADTECAAKLVAVEARAAEQAEECREAMEAVQAAAAAVDAVRVASPLSSPLLRSSSMEERGHRSVDVVVAARAAEDLRVVRVRLASLGSSAEGGSAEGDSAESSVGGGERVADGGVGGAEENGRGVGRGVGGSQLSIQVSEVGADGRVGGVGGASDGAGGADGGLGDIGGGKGGGGGVRDSSMQTDTNCVGHTSTQTSTSTEHALIQMDRGNASTQTEVGSGTLRGRTTPPPPSRVFANSLTSVEMVAVEAVGGGSNRLLAPPLGKGSLQTRGSPQTWGSPLGFAELHRAAAGEGVGSGKAESGGELGEVVEEVVRGRGRCGRCRRLEAELDLLRRGLHDALNATTPETHHLCYGGDSDESDGEWIDVEGSVWGQAEPREEGREGGVSLLTPLCLCEYYERTAMVGVVGSGCGALHGDCGDVGGGGDGGGGWAMSRGGGSGMLSTLKTACVVCSRQAVPV